MTPEELTALIAAGETLAIEFKGEERARINDNDLIEAVVCLANRGDDAPAWLLVGVEDDGRITGARPRHESGRTDPGRLNALISNRTRPSLAVRTYELAVDERAVIAIEIPRAYSPVATSDGRYARRGIGSDGKPGCLPFLFHEMQSRLADRGTLDYSALVVSQAGWDDLDPLEFERLRRSIRENRGRSDEALLGLPDEELAAVLGAIERTGEGIRIRVLGLLLFGKPEALVRLLPTHEVAFQVLRGIQVEVNDFFRWPLLRAMEEIQTRFRARNQEQEILVGMLRIGVPDYSPAAFREGAANALIHRDYSRLGAVHVQWHDDRLEIASPGGFPEGVRLDNLLVTPPRPRNPLLADAFKRIGIVERTARGVDTIFEEQLRNGRPAPSYERSNETGVVLELPGGKANLDFVTLVAEEGQRGRAPGLDDLLLLNRLWQERTTTTSDAAQLLQKPEATARARLQRLLEAGLVEGRGQGRGRSYHLSAAPYRRLGKTAAYVRQRGFEPLQQEQMILQYVDKHGRITRREAAELCQISVDQAKRLLGRLVQRGELAGHGELKGRYYGRHP